MNEDSYDEKSIDNNERTEIKKKAKKPITEKQKAARSANLAKGRAVRKRKSERKKKVQAAVKKQVEYNLNTGDSDDSDTDSEIDLDSLVLSKRGSKKEVANENNDELRLEMKMMRKMMQKLSKERKYRKGEGTTKLVLVPPSTTNRETDSLSSYTPTVNQLLRALQGKK